MQKLENKSISGNNAMGYFRKNQQDTTLGQEQ